MRLYRYTKNFTVSLISRCLSFSPGVCQTTVNMEESALKLETPLNVHVKALDTLVPPATTVSHLKSYWPLLFELILTCLLQTAAMLHNRTK